MQRCIWLGCWDLHFLPTNGFSIKPLKVKLLAGEQNATEYIYIYICSCDFSPVGFKGNRFHWKYVLICSRGRLEANGSFQTDI